MTLIFLDTNIIESTQFNPDSLKLNILKKYFEKIDCTTKEDISVCIPEIVVNELVKRRREKISEHYENYKNSIQKLNKYQSQQEFLAQDISPEKIAFEHVNSFLRRLNFDFKFGRHYQIISDDVATLGPIKDRCIQGRKPFSKDGKKGFRDAIIWEILKHYVNAKEENVIFITKDTDFVEKDDKGKLSIDKEIVNELNKEILVLGDFTDLDVELDETPTKIENYIKYFDENKLLKILEDSYRDTMFEFVYFPESYDVDNVTHEEEIFNTEFQGIIKLSDDTDIIKFKFDYFDNIKTFIEKSCCFDKKFFIGNFQIQNIDWNENSTMVDCLLALEITLLIKYNHRSQEIVDTNISLTMNVGDMHRMNNVFGKYRQV